MLNTIYKLLLFFLIYSFIGWILETVVAATKQKRFVNRGIINGPFCVIYGNAAIVITLVTQELNGVWLFLGSMILATLVEWVAGGLIEKMYHERWWNYSSLPWNLDGYISAPTSVLWGALGFIMMKWGNDLCISIYEMFPGLLVKLLIAIVAGVVVLDGAATMIILKGRSKKLEQWKATNELLDSVSATLGNKIYILVDKRISRAYPQKVQSEEAQKEKNVFAYGCNFYKLFLLFFIGAFLGDIIETIFCRFALGTWMSRSSVVWGPFSIVWGLGIAAVTALLYRYRNKSDAFLFFTGVLLGGAYEYICSVFTEVVFGAVFWDYSGLPYNLGGRINLLYCLFWGIAAVIWFKKLYPLFSKLIEKMPLKPGKIVTWLLVAFMTCNIVMSSVALIRYNSRSDNIEASNSVEEWIDEYYNDVKMEKIYPKAKKVN